MHTLYKKLFLSRIDAAVAGSRAAAAIDHQGLKGQIRQILVRDLFRPLLPFHMSVGTGKIISSDGRMSSEQDLILYDRQIIPAFLVDEQLGLFPIESVSATIEVKSNLTREELVKSHTAAQGLASFPILAGFFNPDGTLAPHETARPVSYLFAYNTDLSENGKSEMERYEEVLVQAQAKSAEPLGDPPIKAICVAGRGFWGWDRNIGWNPKTQSPANESTNESVLGFLAHLSRQHTTIIAGRGRPQMEHYLV
jgi:hypothetical protein